MTGPTEPWQNLPQSLWCEYWARGKEKYRENELTCSQSNSRLVTRVWAEFETPEPHCYALLHTINWHHSVPIPTKVASLELILGGQNSCTENISFDICAKGFLKSEVFHFRCMERRYGFCFSCAHGSFTYPGPGFINVIFCQFRNWVKELGGQLPQLNWVELKHCTNPLLTGKAIHSCW